MTIPRNLSFLAQGASSTGVLGTANGGTNLTSFTVNGIPYASSSSVLTTGTGLTYNGTVLTNTTGGNLVNTSGGYNVFTPSIGALTGAYGSNNTASLYLAGGTGNNGNQVGHYINSVMSGNGGGGGTASLQFGTLQWTGTVFNVLNEQMRLFASGGVSIGNTTDPGASNLSVNTQLFVNTTTSPSNTNSGNSYSSLGQMVMESINAISVGTTAVQITKNGGFGGMAFITANQGGYNYNAVVIWSANGTVTVVSSNGTLGYLQVVNYSLGGPYNGQLFMSVSGISGGNLTVNGIAFTTNRA